MEQKMEQCAYLRYLFENLPLLKTEADQKNLLSQFMKSLINKRLFKNIQAN